MEYKEQRKLFTKIKDWIYSQNKFHFSLTHTKKYNPEKILVILYNPLDYSPVWTNKMN